MALTVGTRNAMLDSLNTLVATVSLHTSDPGATGAGEVTGGSPAYTREAAPWVPASGGNKTTSGAITFDVPGGTTVSHFGLWSGDATPVFRGGGALSSVESFTGQGTYTIPAGDLDVNLT